MSADLGTTKIINTSMHHKMNVRHIPELVGRHCTTITCYYDVKSYEKQSTENGNLKKKSSLNCTKYRETGTCEKKTLGTI